MYKFSMSKFVVLDVALQTILQCKMLMKKTDVFIYISIWSKTWFICPATASGGPAICSAETVNKLHALISAVTVPSLSPLLSLAWLSLCILTLQRTATYLNFMSLFMAVVAGVVLETALVWFLCTTATVLL